MKDLPSDRGRYAGRLMRWAKGGSLDKQELDALTRVALDSRLFEVWRWFAAYHGHANEVAVFLQSQWPKRGVPEGEIAEWLARVNRSLYRKFP